MADFYSDFRHGSARWATDHDCTNAGLFGNRGVYIGQSPERGLDMTLEGDAPIIIIGGSGSGKTADLIMYSAFYPGSMYVLDPKGEIAMRTAEYHRRTGKDVYFVNPAGLHGLPSHSFNPLDILTPENPTLAEDIDMFMEAAVTVPDKSPDDSWIGSTKMRAGKILKHLVFLKEGRQTLMNLKNVLDMIRGEWEQFFNYAAGSLLTSPHADIRTAINELIAERQDAPKQYQGFIFTLSNAFKWLDYPTIQKTIAGHDFSMSALSDGKPAVVFWIVRPEHMGLLKNFNRLGIASPVLHKNRRPHAPPVLYVLDEMAQLGKSEMIKRLYTVERGGGNRVVGVLQSIAQMRDIYGTAGPQIFLSSSQAQIFKGCRDPETASMIDAMLGSMTLEVPDPRYQAQARLERQRAVNAVMFEGADPFQAGMHIAHWKREEQMHREKIERKLLEPAEALELRRDQMIVRIAESECPPILAKAMPYYQRHDLAWAFN